MSEDGIINFIKLWLASSLIIALLLDARSRINTAYTRFNSEYPPLIKCLSILVFLGGVVTLYLSIINCSDFIILLTLEGIIFYTYYTYKLAEISAKGYTLVEAQKKHTQDLKKFLDEWQEYIASTQIRFETDHDTLNEAEMHNKMHTSMERWGYNDLTNYHLPEKHKNIVDKWNQFKSCDYELRLYSAKLYKMIESDINAKIRDDLIEKFKKYDETLDVKDGGLKTLGVNLYKLTFNYTTIDSNKPNKSGPDASGMYLLRVFGVDAQNELLSSRSNDAVMYAETRLNEIINPKYLQDLYGRDVENMRKTDNELSRVRSELIESLDELKGWPLLPGTKCDRLKDFDFSRPK